VTTAWSFVDSGAVGNPLENYYYLVFSANELIVSGPSNRIGEFDRNLLNDTFLAKTRLPVMKSE